MALWGAPGRDVGGALDWGRGGDKKMKKGCTIKGGLWRRKTSCLYELFRKVRANFCLLSCDKSQEPSRDCSEKLVLFRLTFFGHQRALTVCMYVKNWGG